MICVIGVIPPPTKSGQDPYAHHPLTRTTALTIIAQQFTARRLLRGIQLTDEAVPTGAEGASWVQKCFPESAPSHKAGLILSQL